MSPVPRPRSAGSAEQAVLDLLEQGELTVLGRIVQASNAVLLGRVTAGAESVHCVYKPVAGERPLWDFPDGTLAGREVAAYTVSRAAGWHVVPPTVLRDGPFGPGMCQLWIGPPPEPDAAGEDDDAPEAGPTGDAAPDHPAEAGAEAATGAAAGPEADAEAAGEPAAESVDATELFALVDADEPGPGWRAVGRAEVGPGRTALLVHADDPRLRRIALFDAVVNNGDRKGGHLLRAVDGRLLGIDHGVTFNVDPKLRTLLWGWAGEPLEEAERALLGRLATAVAGPTGETLAAWLTGDELAALRDRIAVLLADGRYPLPTDEWPAIPWPPI
ncbi:SCO1664 family protein [Allostreptomyces psammosilenae]|uniref:SCO1664 family protein n=1 Tax=Allostreptomyces psammosilenae TaxID=1892865 RepID=UPI001FE3E9B7